MKTAFAKMSDSGGKSARVQTTMNNSGEEEFLDDFEIFRARANSGGGCSFGFLRQYHPPLSIYSDAELENRNKPIFTEKDRRETNDASRRSRSLVPNDTEIRRSLLRELYDQAAESRREYLERRRHSSPCGGAVNLRRQRFAMQLLAPPPKTPEVCRRPSATNWVGSGGSDWRREAGPPDDEQLSFLGTRRRSFTTTPRGLINDGDEIILDDVTQIAPPLVAPPTRSRPSSDSSQSTRESDSGNDVTATTTSGSETSMYKVLMLGCSGVGKTALTQQFMTSEYMAAQNTSIDDGVECLVPVLLDGEESILQFLDLPYTGISGDEWKSVQVDALVLVYSINDRQSFQKVVDLLYDIRQAAPSDNGEESAIGGDGEGSGSGVEAPVIIITANKSDLVRTRVVSQQEGISIATTYKCKYSEVSAILNHRVDNLLVDILKEIRSRKTRKGRGRASKSSGRGSEKKRRSFCRQESGDTRCWPRSPTQIIGDFLRHSNCISKSCDNLTFED